MWMMGKDTRKNFPKGNYHLSRCARPMYILLYRGKNDAIKGCDKELLSARIQWPAVNHQWPSVKPSTARAIRSPRQRTSGPPPSAFYSGPHWLSAGDHSSSSWTMAQASPGPLFSKLTFPARGVAGDGGTIFSHEGMCPPL